MSGNVHPNSCPIFPCSVCTANVTWRGRSVQCCICSDQVHLKCSPLFISRFRTLGSSHSWSCPPCCVPASSGYPTPTSTVTSSSNFSSWYTSTAQSAPSGPLLLMQHLHPTLAFKPLFLFCPLCIFSLCTHTTASCSWLFLFTSCFFFPFLTPSGFFNEMLGSMSQEH